MRLRSRLGLAVAVAEARTAYCGDTGHIDLVMKRSTDDGATWGEFQIVLQGTDSDPEAAATRGNPAPCDRRLAMFYECRRNAGTTRSPCR